MISIDNSLLADVIQSRKAQLTAELNHIDQDADRLNNTSWSVPQRFLTTPTVEFQKISGKIGVYVIYHVSDQITLFYVGQGNISNRKDRHRKIYCNNGKPVIHFNATDVTSTTDSIIGRKMYQTDPEPTNWYFSYFECPKPWAIELEKRMVQTYQPPGNAVI